MQSLKDTSFSDFFIKITVHKRRQLTRLYIEHIDFIVKNVVIWNWDCLESLGLGWLLYALKHLLLEKS